MQTAKNYTNKTITDSAYQKFINRTIKKHLKSNNITAENFIFNKLKFKENFKFSSIEQESNAFKLEALIIGWNAIFRNARNR